MGTSTIELGNRLAELAGGQGGYFTAGQAMDIGYADSVHGYHVKNGDWVKVQRGIYRLASIPEVPEGELAAWSLWSRGRDDRPDAVFSHETALALHGAIPQDLDVIHMTVPRSFRRNSEIPSKIVLHKEDLPVNAVQQMGCLLVTNMAKTMKDVMESCTNPKILDIIKEMASPVPVVPALAGGPATCLTGADRWEEAWMGEYKPAEQSGFRAYDDAINAGED